eukprot:GHVL01041810.1.p1 GENE.GHVL01041810.1~~GHVL01041810.1.p1  ORF type:complete len:128 (+),score=14.31 GHVL01041810.1:539-922(+)
MYYIIHEFRMRESLETRLNKKLPNFIHKTFSTFDQLEKNIKNHDTMIFDDSFFRAWIDYTKDKKYYILRLSTINNIILETYRPTILVQMLSEVSHFFIFIYFVFFIYFFFLYIFFYIFTDSNIWVGC